jgi:hypothetical protein
MGLRLVKRAERAPQMKRFTIDSKNRIQAEHSTKDQSQKRGLHFSSQRDWARIAADFPLSRLVEIWNRIPGVAPLQRFTSRQIALNRIWTMLQGMEPKHKRTEHRPGVHTNETTLAGVDGKRDAAPREGRSAQVIALLTAEGGASLEQLAELTGWQRHSLRGFLSGTIRKRMGLNVISSNDANGTRTYRIIP